VGCGISGYKPNSLSRAISLSILLSIKFSYSRKNNSIAVGYGNVIMTLGSAIAGAMDGVTKIFF
jgi:hypothetical protein